MPTKPDAADKLAEMIIRFNRKPFTSSADKEDEQTIILLIAATFRAAIDEQVSGLLMNDARLLEAFGKLQQRVEAMETKVADLDAIHDCTSCHMTTQGE